MKKLALILAALTCISLLAACSPSPDKNEDTSAATETKEAAIEIKSPSGVSLAELASALGECDLLGKDTKFRTSADEYAGEDLEFVYGLDSYKDMDIADFIVSECGSNEAYTCVVLLFGEGVEKGSFDAAEAAFGKYADELHSAVVLYDPDAAQLCLDYEVRTWKLEGADSKSANALYFMISDDNAALAGIIDAKLDSLFTAD